MNEITINTTQNVTINFIAATIGERLGAYLIDFLIRAAYVIAVLFLLFNVFKLEKLMNGSDNWQIFSLYSVILLPYSFYSLVLESFFEGQTIGKKVVKIKVVKIDGYQAGFGDYLMRWFFDIIDHSIIGLIVMATSKKTQRIGDMAAGTAVITLKNNVTIKNTILEDIEEQYLPVYPLVIKLSDNDMRIIKETFLSAVAKNDYQLILKLREKIEVVSGIKNTSGNDQDFIKTILKDYNFYTQNM